MADTVTLRRVTGADADALIHANRASRDQLARWIDPVTDMAGFDRWFADITTARHAAFIADADGAIAGLVILNEIVLGNFRSASLGYYAMAGFGGRGLMTRAVELVVLHAFRDLDLHRVESNVQPGNLRSRALVKRLGFTLEGFSPRYLHIAGAWRDHERWAKLADEDRFR